MTLRPIAILAGFFLAWVSPNLATAQGEGGPNPLSSWVLDGELIDDEEVVRSFLRPIIQKRGNWSSEDQLKIKDFLLDFGYYSTITNEDLVDGSIRATIRVQPATLVRYIEVNLDIGTVKRLRQPIFADELVRKMSLRRGSLLAMDEDTRKTQLDAEKERIRQYLVDDGFFEAKVSIKESSVGPFESKVSVRVVPGPPYFVGTVTVRGNSAILSEDITPGFRHRRLCFFPGACLADQRFSRTQLRKDVRKLVERYQRKEGFPGVRIRDDYDPRHSYNTSSHKVNLNIDVSERRRIDVAFEGNITIPDTTLIKKLTIYELASYDKIEVQNSAESIREFYQSKGYFQAQITWARERFVDLNFERILFFVDEGPKLPVRQVKFVGNDNLSDRSLRSTLGTQVYRRRILGGASGYTTSGLLKQDMRTILSSYKSRGFLDAGIKLEIGSSEEISGFGPVLAASVAGQRKASGLYIRFHVEEGQRSSLESISLQFEGTHDIDESVVRKQMTIADGQSYRPELVTDNAEKIKRYYASKGYPRTKVHSNTEFVGQKVRVSYSILENSQARIGKIAIRGNFKTQDWVIRRALNLKEGDLLTPKRTRLAQSNLRQSNLFSTASMKVIGLSNDDQEVVNIIVRVQESRDTPLIYQVGLGWSTDSRLFVEAKGTVPNIGGIGVNLDLELFLGERQQAGELNINVPRWVVHRYLQAGLDLDIALSGKNEETERFGELTTQGVTIALSRTGRSEFFQGFDLSMRYDFRRRNRKIDLVRPAGNSGDLEQAAIDSVSSSVGPRLIIDKRRDQQGNLNAASFNQGFRTEFQLQFAEDYALGSNRFLKLGFSGQYYRTISDRLMLSTALSYDHGVPLGGRALLPEIERYFAGGDTTVRGYERDHLAVELIENTVPGAGSLKQFRIVPAGGNIRLIQNIDLQINVWEFLNFPVASAIFIDTGLITNSLLGVDLSDFGVGMGVALARWITPFGSLSFEYAVPLTPKLGDNPRGRWHVNFGVLYN